MTNERIQHLKDVIFTAETLGSKDKTVKITHEEAKELFALQSENERLKAEREYWKERCLLSEDCLEKSPCDPDITSEQIEAWGTYHRFIKEFGIQPPKQ